MLNRSSPPWHDTDVFLAMEGVVPGGDIARAANAALYIAVGASLCLEAVSRERTVVRAI